MQNAFKEIVPLISKKNLVISNKYNENYNQIIIRIYQKWNNKKLEEFNDNQSIFDNSEAEYTENKDNINDSFIQIDTIFYNILFYIFRKRKKNLLLSLNESLINENPKNKLIDDISNFF